MSEDLALGQLQGDAAVTEVIPGAPFEGDLRRLFSIPDTCAVAALIVLGRPVAAARRLRRQPVEGFTWVDRYEGPTFDGA